MQKGKLIAFEGIDGAGSTTQANMLVGWLNANKISAFYTKEPTDEDRDSPIGKYIRDVLQGRIKLGDYGLQLLFTADRTYHVDNILIPALEKGEWAVTDRYLFSTLAYGSLIGDRAKSDALNRANSLFPVPVVTFHLEIAVEQAIERIKGRGKVLERYEKTTKLESVADAYRRIFESFRTMYIPELHRFVTIDASQSAEMVHRNVVASLSGML